MLDYSKLSDNTLKALSENREPDYASLNDDELSELSKIQEPTSSVSTEQKSPELTDTEKQQKAYEKTGALGSTLAPFIGVGKGMSLGFGDELGAAALTPVKAIADVLHDKFGGDAELRKQGFKLPKEEGPQGILDTYRGLRDTGRTYSEDVATANPYTSFASEMLGIGVNPINKLGTVAKGAGLLEKVGTGAASGAVTGGTFGLGSSNADLTKDELDQASQDVTQGALLGGGIGGAIPLAVAPVSNLASGIKNTYNESQALAPLRNAIRISAQKGERVTGPAAKQTAIENQAKNILDMQDVAKQQFLRLNQKFSTLLDTKEKYDITGLVNNQIEKATKIAKNANTVEERTAGDSLVQKLKEFKLKFLKEGIDPEDINLPSLQEVRKTLEKKRAIIEAQNQAGYPGLKAEHQIAESAILKPNVDISGGKVYNAQATLPTSQDITKNIKQGEFQKMTPEGEIRPLEINRVVKDASPSEIQQITPTHLGFETGGVGTVMEHAPVSPYNPISVGGQELSNLEKIIAESARSGDTGLPQLSGMGKEFRTAVRGTPEAPGLLGARGEPYKELMQTHNEYRKAKDIINEGKKANAPQFGNISESDVGRLTATTKKLRVLTEQGESNTIEADKLKRGFFKVFKDNAKDGEELVKINQLEQKMTDEAWRSFLASNEPKNIAYMMQHLILTSSPKIGEAIGRSKYAVGKLLKPTVSRVNELLGHSPTKLNEMAATQQNPRIANFLRNLALQDESKKKAILFSASQNPELAKELGLRSETSKGNE